MYGECAKQLSLNVLVSSSKTARAPHHFAIVPVQETMDKMS